VTPKRVLVIYFSFSSQTRNLVRALIAGLKKNDVIVKTEIIKPVESLNFPIGTYFKTIRMMFHTCFRPRVEIEPIDDQCFEEYDLIIIGGPTWSYNPSGPILAFLDRDGSRVLKNKTVLPLISCRGYWRLHYLGLKKLLRRCQATVLFPVIFTHTTKEPWRTIGVFLKLAGKVPESGKSWFGRYYPKYGHSRDQIASAQLIGQTIGEILQAGKDLNIMFVPIPVPFKKIDEQ